MKCKPSEVRFLEMAMHPAGKCDDCSAGRSGAKIAKQWAKDHVVATGHTVRVETVTVIEYWAPEPKEANDGGDREPDGRVGA